MKKHFLLGFLLFLLIIPTIVFAKYRKTNLEEALNEEVIIPKFSSYEENDEQVIIYLFRGNGCQFCRSFLEFLNSIVDEYGKYFKVESYEVWNNDDNKSLLKDVATHLGYTNYGIPFIIIGEQVFTVYNSTRDEEIINAIIKQYEKNDRYDVLIDMGIKKGPLKINYNLLINIVLIIAIGGLTFLEIKNRKAIKELNKRLEINENRRKKEVK